MLFAIFVRLFSADLGSNRGGQWVVKKHYSYATWMRHRNFWKMNGRKIQCFQLEREKDRERDRERQQSKHHLWCGSHFHGEKEVTLKGRGLGRCCLDTCILGQLKLFSLTLKTDHRKSYYTQEKYSCILEVNQNNLISSPFLNLALLLARSAYNFSPVFYDTPTCSCPHFHLTMNCCSFTSQK